MSILGKVVLVTGAGQGISRAIALRLAKDGADIALVVCRVTISIVWLWPKRLLHWAARRSCSLPTLASSRK